MISFGTTSWPWLLPWAGVPLFVTLFFLMFFRDPDRRIADGIVSPADGKVVRIDEVDDPDIGPCHRIAIFMSPVNVHVNRMPLDMDVRSVTHIPGKHVPAFNKDSDRNERVVTIGKTAIGDVKVVQIAGAVARRIQPYHVAGDHVLKGERFGLIKLGSRCDLYLPVSAHWQVKLNDRVFAGSTTVAL